MGILKGAISPFSYKSFGSFIINDPMMKVADKIAVAIRAVFSPAEC